MKRKIMKAAIVFFCAMILFTILSRIAYNICTPKVVVDTAHKMELGMESSEKKIYSSCLPLEAIHQGENGFYVNVLDKKESILGDEIVARRKEVAIEYKEEGFVAVDGVGYDEKVIISADREITDGGRVKPLEQ